MSSIRRLGFALFAVVFGTFSILAFFGREVYRQAPPIPERVQASTGEVLFTKEDILRGQQVWQSIGGQQVGSIWGHGAYQAPDWSADFLHREATSLLDGYAQTDHGASADALSVEQRAALEARVKHEMRHNGYDAETGALTISAERAAAVRGTAQHYLTLFGPDPALADLRESYALRTDAVPDPELREDLTAFFFWAAWACAAERPGSNASYTNNWPHEQLVGNAPTSSNILWSIGSIILLLAGIGALAWYQAHRREEEPLPEAPERDPLAALALTPSMRAVAKYCIVVVALLLTQVGLGALTAHYTVESDSFFGIPIAGLLPYAVTRTWHMQLAVFWIATAFLAAGLFLAPAVGGREPAGQKLGVNVLFVALVIVVAGSLGGEWLAIQQRLGLEASFWVGHQGYEFVELGRLWQVALFVGLALWLFLMLRALWPALTRRDASRPIVMVFAAASVAIGLFYGSGFFYGARSHLSVMEYWRWWVVHLWVEGFMEVFATAAIAFLFARLGLIRPQSAGRAVLFSTCIFLFAGIPGTFHHLYFSGTPVSIMAVGATFSALEVVPLVLIGFEAFETRKMQQRAPWMDAYRWPIAFFVAVAFWNLVGAGLFGFLINPPIALYYVQGLNTTAVHGHTSLFGVYGMLGLGLVLFVLRRLRPEAVWHEGRLSFAFWAMNGGLALMVLLSVLPVGIAQAKASIEHGLWFARSADFLQQPWLENLRWMRAIGDSAFLAGAVAFGWAVAGMWSSTTGARVDEGFAGEADAAAEAAE